MFRRPKSSQVGERAACREAAAELKVQRGELRGVQ